MRTAFRILAGAVLCQAWLALSVHAALLDVTRLGEGAISPGVGVHSYSHGSQVTLTATPANSWVVDHWEGDLTGAGATRTITMSGDKRVTVVFMPQAAAPSNALARYVGKLDTNYNWSEYSDVVHFGWNNHTILMHSQQWRNTNEVDRPLWTHDVGIIVPWFADSHCVLLVNGGGYHSGPPQAMSSGLAALAFFLGTVYAQVSQIPNEPLSFTDETNHPRTEDAILAYSMNKYLVTGDDTWPVHVAMTKAVVRAMDTIQKRLPWIRDFLVTGGSKRGWTTYLTAAADPRVSAIAPLSADLPNLAAIAKHIYEAYGFYPPAVQDYVAFNLFCRAATPEGQDLLQIIDPYSYFPKYTMPKLLLNSAGDQFFPSDASRFYYAELPAPKWLRYTVNTDHTQIQDPTSVTTVLVWAFELLHHPNGLPEFAWTFEPDGSIHVQTFTKPHAVALWQAHNPTVRDFRLESIGPAWRSTPLSDQGGGVYIGHVPPPAQGWTAFVVELDFGYGFILSTEVHITPDTLPFAGQACQ